MIIVFYFWIKFLVFCFDFEKNLEKGFKYLILVFVVSIGLILLAIVLLILFQLVLVIKVFGLGFIINNIWNFVISQYGILVIMVGILVNFGLVLLLVIFLGIGMVLFLSEDFIFSKICIVFIFMVELLVVIFSVVYGLWGIFVIIFLIKLVGMWLNEYFGWIFFFSILFVGFGMLFVSIVLVIMILLIIMAIVRDFLVFLLLEL